MLRVIEAHKEYDFFRRSSYWGKNDYVAGITVEKLTAVTLSGRYYSETRNKPRALETGSHLL